MGRRYDIAIVGAGCAGLSLAWHLLDAGYDPSRFLLIEPRTEYRRDRTWCFFDVWPHPFEHLVSHRWQRWRVRVEGPWVERQAPGVSYGHLPSDAFYDATLARLASAGVELRLGVRAGALEEDTEGVRVHTDGEPIDAGVVFDSRPLPAPPPSGEGVSLLQHFEGWVVECAADRFDPEVATLMDFSVPQEHGIHFLYVLPFDRRSALIEATWFSPELHDWAIHQAAIERHLEGATYEVVHRERGVIPMTSRPFPSRHGRRVYPIGVAGGLAKPSTGYAFIDIQRFSAELARRIVREPIPEPPTPRPGMTSLQDHVFLSYLMRYPSEAGRAMVGMFEQVPADLVPRFLHDRVSRAERVRVMRTMPVLAMGGELIRSAPAWLRR